MTFFLYNLLLLPFYPAIALYTLWRRFGQKKSAASLKGQWGSVPREVIQSFRAKGGNTPVIWIHAVSVGEQMAARPIARALKAQIAQCTIVLSVTTDTGFVTAQSALKAGEVESIFYFPLDLPFTVTRALNAIRPTVFIAVETELWPNFLHLAHARGVLCLLANGRVSDNLFKRAVKTKWLWRWMISCLDGLLMRSDYDAGRMRQIAREVGASSGADKIVVTGDVKLDGAGEFENSNLLRKKWRDILKIGDEELLWVCGSTHPDLKENAASEEEIALSVWIGLRKDVPLRLLLAPRHIERVGDVAGSCHAIDEPLTLRSEIENSQSNEVIILDTVGELSEIYAAADVAFVGGSLIRRGGHNVLEPILRGVPVLFGPHMANFRASAELVENSRLGNCVADEEELHAQLKTWLQDEARRKELPHLAADALAPHQGAPMRIAECVAEQLKSKSGVSTTKE